MNFPRSRRLAYSDKPMPSCQRILARSPRRPGVDILVNADALAVTELDLDQAASLRRWGFNRSEALDRSRGDLNRDKARSCRSDSRQAGTPPPREHQTRRNAVPPRDLRHHRAGRQRLLDDPHLAVAGLVTTR